MEPSAKIVRAIHARTFMEGPELCREFIRTPKIWLGTSTLGAAILDGKAVGLYSSVEEAAERMIQIKQRFEPNPANRAVYDDTFEAYTRLYEALCPLFEMRFEMRQVN